MLLNLIYYVSPSSLAPIIAQKYKNKTMGMNMLATYYSSGTNGVGTGIVSISEVTGENNGLLRVSSTVPNTYLTEKRNIYSIALHVADTNSGGTDYTTDFTLMSNETGHQPVKNYSLIGKWRRTKISLVNLKLTTYVYSWYFYGGESCRYGEWIQGEEKEWVYPEEPDGAWRISGDNTLTVNWYYSEGERYYIKTESYTYSFSDDGNTLVLTATDEDYHGTGGTYTRYE